MTDETIIRKLEILAAPGVMSAEEWMRVKELARIGAAVQPRPISEAPKDDTVLLYICAGSKNPTYKDGEQGGWREHYIDDRGTICDTGSWIQDSTINDRHWKVTGWLPLSALPKPQEPT